MANKQIPNLEAAIGLTGAEQLEIVQGGESKRTTVGAVAMAPSNIENTPITSNSMAYYLGLDDEGNTRLGYAPTAVNMQDEGVVADGNIDGTGTNNTQAIIAANLLARTSKRPILEFPAGDIVFRKTDGEGINIFRAITDADVILQGDSKRGTRLIIANDPDDPSSDWTVADVAISATNPDDPAARGRDVMLRDIQIVYADNVSFGTGPIAFQCRYGSYVKLIRSQINNFKGNTSISLSGLRNSLIDDLTLFGAGYNIPYKSSEDVTFSITSGDNTLTSSIPHFSIADEGHFIFVRSTSGVTMFEIATYINSTTVETVEASPFGYTDCVANWEGVRGSMTSPSTTLTMERACLTANDVGRVVYVMDAQSGATSGSLGTSTGPRPLRATILSVGGGGSTAVLSVGATATATDVYVIFSPAVDIFSENTSGEETNDFQINSLNIERYYGLGIAMEEAINVKCTWSKVHGEYKSNMGDDNASLMNCLFSRTSGFFSGDIEGQSNNSLGQIVVSDSLGLLRFDELSGDGIENLPSVYWLNDNAYGMVSVGDIAKNSFMTPDSLADAVASRNVFPSPEFNGFSSSYKQASQPSQILPQDRSFGRFRSPFQTNSVAFTALGTDSGVPRGPEVILYDGSPTVEIKRANGSVDAPTAIVNFDEIGRVRFWGYTPNGDMVPVGYVACVANGAPSGDDIPTRMMYYVTNASGDLINVWSMSANALSPAIDDSYDIGSASLRVQDIFGIRYRPGSGTAIWTSGTGTPEGNVTAPVGSMFTRTDGGALTTLYVKESGAGNTGWVAK